jgi:hypothetical protein
MTIELNEYGFMFDMGDFIYVSLSWQLLIVGWSIALGVIIYKRKKNK